MSENVLIAAIKMLHEQAHDARPIQMCSEEPCKDLDTRHEIWRGPGPLIMGGKIR